MKKIYGIVGHPVIHSLSPVIHKAAFQAEGIDAEYRIFDINPEDPENLANFCYETEVNGIAGFSVTMPYKEEILPYLDEYDPLVKLVGSANTVKNEDSMLIGYNTDTMGAIAALREKTDIQGKRILVLGAGGASRAVCYGLKEFGGRISIFNRTHEKAEELADELEIDAIEFRHIKELAPEIVINCTPVGSVPNTEESLLHAPDLAGVKVVMDIITRPMETRLLKEAKKAGAEVISGERMLLHQAAGQFAIWFSKPAPFEVMEKALYGQLKKTP